MSLHPILSMAHAGAAILLFSLAIISLLISVLIAVKPAADHASDGLTRKANTVGLIENIVVAIVTLTGVITVFTGSWSFSQLWLWMGLLIAAIYSAALIFLTKPARLLVAKGGSEVKAGMQVVLQIGHVLLLIVAFAVMALKPT
jgi:hypothetical protein